MYSKLIELRYYKRLIKKTPHCKYTLQKQKNRQENDKRFSLLNQMVGLRGQLDLKINENQKLEEMKNALSASSEELNKTLEDLNQS